MRCAHSAQLQTEVPPALREVDLSGAKPTLPGEESSPTGGVHGLHRTPSVAGLASSTLPRRRQLGSASTLRVRDAVLPEARRGYGAPLPFRHGHLTPVPLPKFHPRARTPCDADLAQSYL